MDGAGGVEGVSGPLTDPEVTVGHKVHVLKTWPDQYRKVVDGTKTFEWRLDDRGYAVGDTLLLMEFEPCRRCQGKGKEPHAFQPGSCCQPPYGKYSGREVRRTVTYITADVFGMPKGFVIMATVPCEDDA